MATCPGDPPLDDDKGSGNKGKKEVVVVDEGKEGGLLWLSLSVAQEIAPLLIVDPGD